MFSIFRYPVRVALLVSYSIGTKSCRARDHDDVTNIIGVDIALSDEAVHPHAATATFGGNHVLSS